MKTLFITSTHLGDSILSTGALEHLSRAHPQAEITVACGPVAAGIFSAFPRVSHVIALKKAPYAGHWRRLLRETIGTRWDIVVDLRNSPVSRLLRAGKKYYFRPGTAGHKVEQIGSTLGLAPAPSPVLHITAETAAAARAIVATEAPVLAVGPTANWAGKEWPAASFNRLIARITGPGGFMPGAPVAVIAAPGEEDRARKVLDSLPEGQRIDAIAKGPPLLAAAVLDRCAFYVGNDSGLMHAAAATGLPTLGLFGYGWPALYGPWGPKGAWISTRETPEELIAPYGGDPRKVSDTLMTSLEAEAVYDAAAALWARSR